ncbi:hypothetical protein BSKO_04166 [Bryopsis sp. KO-2023]|nr:hypothetical protein BSKO_04166 [Bryopsis sp. KO-2023]
MVTEDFSTRATTVMSQKTDIDKVLDLFTEPLSADMHDRHAIAIDRLCRNNSNGFAIRDLPSVQQVLELSLALARDGKEEFIGPVCRLFGILSMPFQRRTSTDEYKMLSNITELLSCIGGVFTTDTPTSIQLIATEMLREFATANGRRPVMNSPSETPPEAMPFARQYHTNQGSISRSSLVPSLVTGIRSTLYDCHDEIIRCLVLLTLDISYTKENCDQLVDSGLLYLFPKLFETDACQPIMLEIVNLLWNVLENMSGEINLTEVPQGIQPSAGDAEKCSPLAVQLAHVLMPLWSTLLNTGYRSDDKELRNEVLIIMSLLAKDEIFQVALHEQGFVSLGLEALRCGLGEGGAFKSMAVTSPDLNFELTCLLCTAITDICQHDECLKEALDGGLLHLLLLPLRDSQICSTSPWNADQQAWILRQALHCLSSLVPRCGKSFIELGGVEMVVRFIEETEDEGLLLIAISIVHMSAQSDQHLGKAFGDANVMKALMETYGGSTVCDEARAGAALAMAAICTGE